MVLPEFVFVVPAYATACDTRPLLVVPLLLVLLQPLLRDVVVDLRSLLEQDPHEDHDYDEAGEADGETHGTILRCVGLARPPCR